VFDIGGGVLFDSGTISVTAANSDTTVDVGGVRGARRVRVTGTVLERTGTAFFAGIAELEVISTETVTSRLNDTVRRARFIATASAGDPSGPVFPSEVGLAEFKVLGTALMRRERRVEPNVAHLLPTSVGASSFIAGNPPEQAIDDTFRNWYASSGAAGEFLELEFPSEVTVNELRMSNPSARPDGFGTSLTINCTGSFALLGSDGSVLFDSGLVNQPSGSLNVSIGFTLPVPNIAGIKRARYTSSGCGASFPPGFSEFRVFGSADVDTPALDAKRKFQALVGREVHSTPIVVNLTDDNGDGRVDLNDVPDIAVAMEATNDQLSGEIKVISGDDGRELVTMGGPNLISPWSEPAAGDIDGDGLPEIVAIHSDGNHLIAFEHTGEIKWTSDAHPMPRFANDTRFVGGAVSIANLGGGGEPEIVVGASVFSAEGQLLADGRTLGGTTAGTGLRSAISAVADIDVDGTPELVAGPTAYRLAGGALSIVWRRDDRPDGTSASPIWTTTRSPRSSSSRTASCTC